MEPNLLIAIEGIDACGKGTQVDLLAQALGPNTKTLHFPNYETPTGQLILKMLKGERELHDNTIGSSDFCQPAYDRENQSGSLENALTLQALMLANRYEIIDEITGWLKFGHVILDRYYLSALVYGQADGLDFDWLNNIQSRLPMPDLLITLDISVEESFRRRPERQDAYESNRERLERVRVGYAKYWETYANVEGSSWRGNGPWADFIDGTYSAEAIAQIIMTNVQLVQKDIQFHEERRARISLMPN